MKKYLIIICLLIFAGYSFGQNTDRAVTNQTEQNIMNKSFEKTLEVLRVKNVSGSTTAITLTQAQIDSLQKVSQFPGGQTYADVRNNWDWAKSWTVTADSVRSDSLTVVRSRDTVLIGGTVWAKITIRPTATTDSIAYAIGTTAPSTWHYLYGSGQGYESVPLNKTYFTKVFIKGAGLADHIESYQLVIEAF